FFMIAGSGFASELTREFRERDKHEEEARGQQIYLSGEFDNKMSLLGLIHTGRAERLRRLDFSLCHHCFNCKQAISYAEVYRSLSPAQRGLQRGEYRGKCSYPGRLPGCKAPLCPGTVPGLLSPPFSRPTGAVHNQASSPSTLSLVHQLCHPVYPRRGCLLTSELREPCPNHHLQRDRRAAQNEKSLGLIAPCQLQGIIGCYDVSSYSSLCSKDQYYDYVLCVITHYDYTITVPYGDITMIHCVITTLYYFFPNDVCGGGKEATRHSGATTVAYRNLTVYYYAMTLHYQVAITLEYCAITVSYGAITVPYGAITVPYGAITVPYAVAFSAKSILVNIKALLKRKSGTREAKNMVNYLLVKRRNSVRIGQDIQSKRDLICFVKWPHPIRLQWQRAIFYKSWTKKQLPRYLSLPTSTGQRHSCQPMLRKGPLAKGASSLRDHLTIEQGPIWSLLRGEQEGSAGSNHPHAEVALMHHQKEGRAGQLVHRKTCATPAFTQTKVLRLSLWKQSGPIAMTDMKRSTSVRGNVLGQKSLACLDKLDKAKNLSLNWVKGTLGSFDLQESYPCPENNLSDRWSEGSIQEKSMKHILGTVLRKFQSTVICGCFLYAAAWLQ
ncbi:hypothetical protein U0070_003686, partial [Myodes glareolus]